jgi:hypothetical protein
VVRDGVLQRNPLHPLFDANKFLTALITYLGILLTFGVVFPSLAVAMLVTMLSVAWQGRLEVGRFLCMAKEIDAAMFADVIEQECQGAVTTLQLRQSIFFVICFACCFYALFLFDTLGDAVGFQRAYWVLIVLPLLPLCIYAAMLMFTKPREDVQTHVRKSAEEELGTVELSVQLSPLPPSASAAPSDSAARGQAPIPCDISAHGADTERGGV